MGEYVDVDDVQSRWPLRTVEDVKANGKGALISGPFGSNISAKYFTATGVPVIRGNNLSLDVGVKFKDADFAFITPDKAEELGTWAERDDLLFTAVGTIGQVGYLTGKEEYPRYIISNKQIRLRLDTNKLLPLFAYYWFASPQVVELIQQRNTGSSVPLINLGVVRSLPVPVPEIRVQEAVVEVLSSLDAKIDLLHRQNKTLEAMAEALFRQWFVEEAEEGWEDGTLGQIIDIHDTKRVPLSNLQRAAMQTGKLYPYYGAATIMDQVNDFLFDGEYILLGEDGSVVTEEGYPVLQYATGKFWVNNHAHVLTAKPPYTNRYLWTYLKHQNIADIVTGAVQPKISQGNLKALPIVLPPREVVENICAAIAPLYAKLDKNIEHTRTLTALRDTLLPKLMSGEVRVEAAKSIVA